ncbi:MAG: transporter substrate-binding domain-containing protein [Phormidesmis sp.]
MPQILAVDAIANDSSTAAIITAFPEKMPHTSLRRNSRGQAVQALQGDLETLGYEAVGRTPGLFDTATDRAVRRFQRSEGLMVDGIVGPVTQARLAAIKAGTETQMAQFDNNRARLSLPPDIQRIIDRKILVVSLLDEDNPPFFMLGKDGQLDGSDVRMAREIAAALDVEIEFRRSAKTFNEVVDDVYALNADLAISKISRTLKRAKRTRFSEPYLNLRQGLLVNRLQLAQVSRGSNMVEMIRDLEGKIGVIKGSSYAGFVEQKFPKATVVRYSTWDDVVEAVTSGAVLAAYRDELEVKKIVLSRPNSALQFQTIALTDTQDALSIVLPWDSNHLLSFVNQYLSTAELIDTTDGLLKEYTDYFQSS